MQPAPMRDWKCESVEALLNLEVLDTDLERDLNMPKYAGATVCDELVALLRRPAEDVLGQVRFDAAMRELPFNSQTASLRGSDTAPRLSAMRLCLTTTEALPWTTRRLMNSQQSTILAEQVITTRQVAGDIERAGRAAYRAGLALTDPRADEAL